MSAAAHLADWLGRHRRWLLLGLLLLLHLGLMQGVDSQLGRTMLVAHIGLFILWQPFVRAELRLDYRHFAVLFALVGAAIVWLTWGTLAIWVMFIAGIIGGKVFFFGARWSKVFYLLALAYLVAILVTFIIPHSLPYQQTNQEVFGVLASYVLPLLLLGMAILPAGGEREAQDEVIDLIYSIFVFLILAVLVLGSLAFMLVLQLGYIQSLLGALATSALLLFLFSWTWNPLAGFAGLGAVFSRYLLSIGLPFERWMHALAEHSQREPHPEKFLAVACADLVNRLPWVLGGEWQVKQKHGEFGVREGQSKAFQHGALRIVLFSRHPLSPSLIWHFILLVQIIGEFHEAKLSARQLSQMAYLRAIHETGARITHDVKNLMQSLNTLCFAAEREKHETTLSPQFQSLLRRQLPVIAERLQHALDKLRKPVGNPSAPAHAQDWWDEKRQRYAEQEISFVTVGALAGITLPADLFTDVIENLLQNAFDKRRSHPRLKIEVQLEIIADDNAGQAVLTVCDDGAPIPPSVTEELFAGPLPSENGYGISLYQAARHAEANGYRLALVANLPGSVCFRLLPGWA
ncbi:MAG: sensor histidine kinase [Betaproteobacteria bacterium]|nr:sensor histidine kinase [Betaproteobacteria bacterium]